MNIRPLPILIVVLLLALFGRIGSALGMNEALDYLGQLMSGQIARLKGEPMWSLALFAVWLLVGASLSLFCFYLGATSQHWGGWDYLLYGKPFDPSSDDRIDALRVVDLAKQHGWTAKSELLFDLEEGLSDAIANDRITLYGKHVEGHREVHRYSHFKIDKAHLITHKLDLFEAQQVEDPTKASTTYRAFFARGATDHGPVSDLRFDRWQVKKWLKIDASAFKGRQESRDAARRLRQAKWQQELRDQGIAHTIDDGSEQGALWRPGDPPERNQKEEG